MVILKDKKRRRFVAAGSALLIVVLIGTVQFLGPTATSRMQRDIFDFGHVPVFAILAIAILYLVRIAGVASPAGTYARAAVIVATLSVASEVLQLADPNRVASVADSLRNLTGGAIGLLLAAAWHAKTEGLQPAQSPARLVLAAAILLSGSLVPIAHTFVAHLHQWQTWPMIIGSNYILERRFMVAYKSDLGLPRFSSAWRGNAGGRGVLVRAREGETGGILVQELARRLPGDRSDSTRLCFEATNRNREPLPLSAELGSAPMFYRSDTFTRFPLLLAPEQRATQCVQLMGLADPSEITGVAWESMALLFVDEGDHREYLLHRIWLQ